MAPTLQDLSALARSAVARLDGDGQATVWWERRLAVGEHGVSDLVQATAELVVLADGRVGAASTTDLSDAGLDRAAAAAAAHAQLDREPDDARALPQPGAGTAHDGWDGAVLELDPAALAEQLEDAAGIGLAVELRAGAARVAIASSHGADVAEQRSFAAAEVSAPGRPQAVALGPAGLDLAALVDAAEHGFHEGAPQPAEAGAPTVVLGPVAVAQLLEELKPELAGGESLLAARRGDRIAATAIDLADASADTLPRSFDAEGVPRARVELIAGGVARGHVADSASGGSTGHATRPGHAEPWPDHLVLAGGDAADVAALAAPVGSGSPDPRVPAGRAWRLAARRRAPDRGRRADLAGQRHRGGRPDQGAGDDRGALLRRQAVATEDDSALTIGATLAPALRARAGVTSSVAPARPSVRSPVAGAG